jgi:hypothetical protein
MIVLKAQSSPRGLVPAAGRVLRRAHRVGRAGEVIPRQGLRRAG